MRVTPKELTYDIFELSSRRQTGRKIMLAAAGHRLDMAQVAIA